MKPKKKFGTPYLDSEPKQPRSNLIYKSKLKLAVIPEEVEAITQQKIKDLTKKTLTHPAILEVSAKDLKIMTAKFIQYKNQKHSYPYSAWQRGQLAQSIQYPSPDMEYPSPDMENPSPDMENPSPDINYPSSDELLPLAYNTANFGFTDHEIILLRQALRFCVHKSSEVNRSSMVYFADHMDQFRLWFGAIKDPNLQKDVLDEVVRGTQKMHSVLSNYNQVITFVDMRHQRARNGMPSSIHTPAPGLATCYGKSSTEFAISGKYPFHPPAPKGVEVPKHLPTHGMTILIGEHIMQPFQTDQTRAAIIYHELTHQILNTVDDGLISHPDSLHRIMHIFGQNKALQMAYDFPEKTVSIADCWANFVMYYREIY